MKIGLFSDVHGNIDALENSIKYFKSQQVDDMIFMGDAIGYLPEGYECLQLLFAENIRCIKGNHEEMLLGNIEIKSTNKEIYQLHKVLEKCNSLDLEKMNKWEQKIVLDNNKYLFVHGSPSDYINGYIYPNTDLTPYKNLPYTAIIMGHTHRPFIKIENNMMFANVGSVGLPRDVGNYSSLAILDTLKSSLEIIRIKIKKEVITQYMSNITIHSSVKELFGRRMDNLIGKKI